MTADDCPHPSGCPVPSPPGPATASRLRTTTWERSFFRVYDTTFGFDEFNPGLGDTRFAPVDTAGGVVPHLYGGACDVVVLLDTIFHDVHHGMADRTVWLRDLVERGIVELTAPRPLRLIDLRDPQLDQLELRRDQLVSTHAEHYPCTRQWATWLHGTRPDDVNPDGIVWHSRQAELADARVTLDVDDSELFVLFGDHADFGRGGFTRQFPGVQPLAAGSGRLRVDEIAEAFDALVDPST